MSFINKENFSNFTKKNHDRFNEKVKIPIDLNIWSCICEYTLSDNSNITKKLLYDVKKLLNILDLTEYNESIEVLWRINLIQCSLKAQLDDNLTFVDLLKDYCLETCKPVYRNYIKDYFNNNEVPFHLSNEDVVYLSKIISSKLKYSYLYKSADSLQDGLNELKNSNDDKSLESINKKFENIINKLYIDINSAKSLDAFSSMDYNLNDDNSALNSIEKTIEELNKPNNFIKTGLKKLNEILDGGVENGRLYLFFGLPKSFKSGLLLNMAMWACKYNKNIALKDKTKKPCVLYLTMENTVKETTQRMFTYCTGKDIKDFNAKEALQIIRDNISKETGISLEIKYRPNKSISTIDLDAMLDTLNAEGKECIMVVQDYTKRIRSSNYNPDLRLELGQVVDDFTVKAISYTKKVA